MSKEQIALSNRFDQVLAKAKTIEDQRNSLPIYQYKDEFLNALKVYQILIVVAETGSGKVRNQS